VEFFALNSPAISVAMSVYNCEAYLGLAIESILNQTFRDFEFLILNDGSSDGSRAIIDHYAAQDDRIRPIHRENRGLIVSLNQLLDEARAPLVARMDGDDISHPQRFEKQMAFLASHPDHKVLGTWTEDIDEHGNPFSVTGKDHPTTHTDFLASIGERSGLCHPSVIMDRDLALAVGGYHAAFKHCEDYDLWMRLSDQTKICSLPDRLVKYRHSDNQVSTKHIVVQQIGTAVSRLAWRERQAGRPDPTETLDALPPIDDLDALFGRVGVAREVRSITASAILYSSVALTGDGFDLLLDHIRDGERVTGLRRTILRLLRMGQPARAVRLARALVAA
jgi:Glycosyl transferase family 2